jgi:hypothetical protein
VANRLSKGWVRSGRHLHAPQRAAGKADDHGLARLRRIQDGQRVGRELEERVGVAAARSIRASGAAAVERDHAEMAREVRDLRLPDA